MAHRFSIRDIARQAGVSEATVDRVLHGRTGVRQSTVGQVGQAIEELETQQVQLELSGRTFVIDVVVDAPSRFSQAIRAALEAELPLLRPAAFRARFHLSQHWSAEECVEQLAKIARRGSHGVLLKATDSPGVAEAVGMLTGMGIPVVTVVTDLPSTARIAYVGPDNRSAGSTAAYLMCAWLGDRPGDVALTVSKDGFRGEEEREMGFRATLRKLAPTRIIHELPDSEGIDVAAEQYMEQILARHSELAGVYSIGGGNSGLVRAIQRAGSRGTVVIGHDLNKENSLLLSGGALHAVLGHNLRSDMHAACRALMHYHRALPGGYEPERSPIEIHTPYNLPPTAAH